MKKSDLLVGSMITAGAGKTTTGINVFALRQIAGSVLTGATRRGAVVILDTEVPVGDPRGDRVEKKRREDADKEQRTSRVRRILERIIAEHGDPVSIKSITASWGENYGITLVQWLPHGMGGTHREEVDVARHGRTWGEPLTDDMIEKALRAKYGRHLARQRKICDEKGRRPTETRPDQVDLSAYRIEQPLASYLRERLGADAPAKLRELLAREPDGYMQDRNFGTQIRIKANRGVIRGEFTAEVDSGKPGEKVAISWSNGGLKIRNLTMPYAVALGISKETTTRIGSIIEHPLLDSDIPVTDAFAQFRDDGVTVVMSTKNSEIDMPADWI